jgi:hypothetical protein
LATGTLHLKHREMKKETYFLKNQDSLLVEIRWHDYIAGRYIPTPDLIILIDQFYFEN